MQSSQRTELAESAPDNSTRRDRPIILRPENYRERTIESVQRKEHLFSQTMVALREAAFSPERQKHFDRRWRIGQVAEMVGRGTQSIRLKEGRGELERPESDANGRRIGYTLEQINRIRDAFGTRPGRAPTDEPSVIAFSSFKGGCGKSTLSVHFAQYMALRGYRKILFVDCDPQGSATTLFGVNPDLPEYLDVERDPNEQSLDYTLEEYLAGEFTDFRHCIQRSYFPGIDLVPANMSLNNAEYFLAARGGEEGLLDDLRDGIRSVWHDYDVIVVDPPPALGLLSLSVLNAANALIIPLRPTVVDFASTAKFMTMLRSNLQQMINADMDIFYHFETLVVNNMDDSKSAQVELTDAMRKLFGDHDLLDATMKDSAEVDNAAKEMMTVYDLTEPMTSHKTHTRCLNYLNKLNSEIETRIRKTWPSHREALREEAHI